MKHIKLYSSEDAFVAEKPQLITPWVTKIKGDNEIHYSVKDTPEPQPTYEYIDLGLPSGVLWATCNVGAENPWEYGKYFAWGETEGYYDNEEHDFSWNSYKWCNGSEDTLTKYNNNSTYGSVDDKLVLDPEDDAAHAHMGGDWRMPTLNNIYELQNFTNNEWVEGYQGTDVNGRLFTSKKDASKSIFIPASDERFESESPIQGFTCILLSSSINETYPYLSVGVPIHPLPYDISTISENRSNGLCVRGVMDAKA